jgi:hypothetical protein
MKRIDRSEVLGLADYEALREHFRNRVLGEKRRRRLLMGSVASCLFENRDTVLLQIQEMLRTERITKESGIQHEIDTYNDLIPAPGQLSCTLFIEIEDANERKRRLQAALGLERHVVLCCDDDRMPAEFDPARCHADTASAVNYLKFTLTPLAATRLRAQSGTWRLSIEHPAFKLDAPLPAPLLQALAEDLEP